MDTLEEQAYSPGSTSLSSVAVTVTTLRVSDAPNVGLSDETM